MTAVKKIIWHCNLCGRQKEIGQSETPAGWVELTVENYMTERDFREVHVCGQCLKEILVKTKHA